MMTLLLMTMALASDYQSPRTAALGGAGHAGPMQTDAIFLNPSFIAFTQSYSVGFGYQSYSGGRIYSFAVQDGRSPLFQAGVGFTVHDDPLLNVTASKVLGQRIALGLGGKFFMGRDPGYRSAQEINASVTFLPLNWLNVSIIADNLLQTNAARERGLEREFILGTKLNIESILILYGDPHWVPSRAGSAQGAFGYEVGAEFTAFKDLMFRAGMFSGATVGFQRARANGFSVGAGWAGPRISIDYAFTRTTPGPESLDGYMHSIGTTIYF